jgi:hypothetical protein
MAERLLLLEAAQCGLAPRKCPSTRDMQSCEPTIGCGAPILIWGLYLGIQKGAQAYLFVVAVVRFNNRCTDHHLLVVAVVRFNNRCTDHHLRTGAAMRSNLRQQLHTQITEGPHSSGAAQFNCATFCPLAIEAEPCRLFNNRAALSSAEKSSASSSAEFSVQRFRQGMPSLASFV